MVKDSAVSQVQVGQLGGAVTGTSEAVCPLDGRSGHLSFSSIPAPVGQPPLRLYFLCADKEKARELALLEVGTIRLGGRQCVTVTACCPRG